MVPMRTAMLPTCLGLLVIAGCSKTPKEQALAGFSESCNTVDTVEVKDYCSCMVKKLDEAIPARTFNNPDTDPMALMRAFQATAEELAPSCTNTPAAQEAAAAAAAQQDEASGDPSVAYNARDPDSLDRMMRGMSPEQQVQFINDFELLVYLHKGGEGEEGMGDGSVVLNGFTVDKVRAEAPLGRRFIKERNTEFLQKTLNDMQQTGKQDGCIFINKFGVLQPPRTWLRPYDACRRFSREQLESMLSSGGTAPASTAPAPVSTTQPAAMNEPTQDAASIAQSPPSTPSDSGATTRATATDDREPDEGLAPETEEDRQHQALVAKYERNYQLVGTVAVYEQYTAIFRKNPKTGDTEVYAFENGGYAARKISPVCGDRSVCAIHEVNNEWAKGVSFGGLKATFIITAASGVEKLY